MSQLRLNPMNGRWVTIAGDRAFRPSAFESRRLPVEADLGRPCPFCPGNEEDAPPALETYGPSGDWTVRVLPNLYPAFYGNEPMTVSQRGPLFVQAPASGIHEVLVLSPSHDAQWADLEDRQVGLVMAAIRDRIEDHAELSAVQYTQVIVNHGREAGASLEHPHAQLLGIPFIPNEIGDVLDGFGSFDGDLLQKVAELERESKVRVVYDEANVLVICPFWSSVPYEMLVIPSTTESKLHLATPQQLVAVGKAIRTMLARLRQKLGDVPYNIVFGTAPHRHGGNFHWHVRILPKLSTPAGFELGTGVAVNIVPPELAAQRLQED